MRLLQILLLFALAAAPILIPTDALARVRVVCTLPDFGAIAREIGGDRVDVEVLSKGYQDPHFVDPKPSYVLYLNRADILLYNGLGLEIGWLPPLITGSRNSKITSMGSPGHFDLSTVITNVLEVPTTRVDRTMGDIHPGGNPHYLLDPRNGIVVAEGISSRLSAIDRDNAPFYRERAEDFVAALSKKIGEWDDALAPLRGVKVVTYHKLWVYFTSWAGLEEVGHIEPKPGIPPSPAHVARLIEGMKKEGVKFVLAAPYYPRKIPSLVAEKAGARLLVLPTMVGGREGVNTYFDLFDVIVEEIASALEDEKS